MKVCTKCREELPLDAFGRQGDGRHTQCKECRNRQVRVREGAKKRAEFHRLINWAPPEERL